MPCFWEGSVYPFDMLGAASLKAVLRATGTRNNMEVLFSVDLSQEAIPCP